MACDRFIRWPSPSKRPSRAKCDGALHYFFGDSVEIGIRWDRDRWFVALPGKPSTREFDGLRGPPSSIYRKERFIEVHLGKKNLDVMTRQADLFTNCLADGLAKFMAKIFDGELEDA